VMASKPVAYWRLDEMGGEVAHDASGHGHDATFDGGHALYLQGMAPNNHAVHFAGGRLVAKRPALADRFTIEQWFWNGLPTDLRPVTGWLAAVGGDHLLVGGKGGPAGKLVVQTVNGAVLPGQTAIGLREWCLVALVRVGMTGTV